MQNYKQNFIDNFHYLKGNKSINQIAKETKISQPSLNRYANGTIEPTLTNIMKLCEYFKCTPNDLLLK